MTSKPHNKEAFVWIWLSGETQPVVTGKLEADNGTIQFNYGKSYLDRIGDKNPAIPIYEPGATLKELYGRLAFNILCGNTDDHARNHAAFWNGKELTLTPAYDICPQGRTGNEATQAMLITGDNRFSQLKTCLAAAHHFLLSQQAAIAMIERIETAIRENWEKVCEEAELSPVDKNYLWGQQFLNPFSLER